jgi:hypothetical protein
MAGPPFRQNHAAPISWKQVDCSNKREPLKAFSPKSEVEHSGIWRGQRAVPARAKRAEQIVQGHYARQPSFRRLTLRPTTETAQRAIPTNIGVSG